MRSVEGLDEWMEVMHSRVCVECFDIGEMQGSNRDGVLTSVLQPSNTHKRDVFGVSAGEAVSQRFRNTAIGITVKV